MSFSLLLGLKVRPSVHASPLLQTHRNKNEEPVIIIVALLSCQFPRQRNQSDLLAALGRKIKAEDLWSSASAWKIKVECFKESSAEGHGQFYKMPSSNITVACQYTVLRCWVLNSGCQVTGTWSSFIVWDMLGRRPWLVDGNLISRWWTTREATNDLCWTFLPLARKNQSAFFNVICRSFVWEIQIWTFNKMLYFSIIFGSGVPQWACVLEVDSLLGPEKSVGKIISELLCLLESHTNPPTSSSSFSSLNLGLDEFFLLLNLCCY